MSEIVSATQSRTTLLAAVRASPDAVARHDKEGWLSLFSEQAIVEDPVGTAGSRGHGEIGRFYDTFIAPNDVSFEVEQDIVVGLAVARDVVIDIRSAAGLHIRVPAYLLYELVVEGDRLKIARLAAHWELARMAPQVMRQGAAGLRMMASQSVRMIRFQGWRGVRGYMRGFSGIGTMGKDALRRFASAVQTRDPFAMEGLFDRQHQGIEFPAGCASHDAASLVSAVDGPLSVSDPLSAGFTTTFRFAVKAFGSAHRGVGLFEFSAHSRKIRRARFFWDD